MPSASQLASRPVSPQSATPHRFVRQRIDKIIFATALIASATAFIAPLATAQDLGEIARQERAKKQSNPAPPSTHVYTNDDVKREEILTPDDKTRFSAITQPSTTKPAQSATPLASESTPPPGPIPSAVHSEAPAVAKAVAKPAPVPPPSPTVPKVTAAVPVQTPQPVSATTDVAAAQPVAQISVAPIIVAQTIDAPTLATVPLDQMPLGDVARYYRAKNHLYARANSQIDPDPVNAPSAPALATTIPVTISFAQLPLGDVARYYRAKKREEDAAIANRAPTTSAMSVSPCTLPTASSSPSTSKSRYPLTLVAMPLATMKPPPARAPKPRPSPIVPIARHPISHPTKPRPLAARTPVAPKRSVGGQSTSIRISSGDTLWQLARKYLGSGTRWHELAALNPAIQDPRRLQIGAQLQLHSPKT